MYPSTLPLKSETLKMHDKNWQRTWPHIQSMPYVDQQNKTKQTTNKQTKRMPANKNKYFTRSSQYCLGRDERLN